MFKLVLITIVLVACCYLVEWLIKFVKMIIDLIKFDEWNKDNE